MKAIAGEQDGKLKTVDPKKENAEQFLKIDTNGNALENFFKKVFGPVQSPNAHRRLCSYRIGGG